MAAVIRIRGRLATFSKRTGTWTSDYEPLAKIANSLMYKREPDLNHFEEFVDFERTAAQYIVDFYKRIGVEGEIVHVDPYLDPNGPSYPDALDSYT